MKKEVLKEYNNIVSQFKKNCLGKDKKNETALKELLKNVESLKEYCTIELINYYKEIINGVYYVRVNNIYIDEINQFIVFFTMLRDNKENKLK